MFYFYCDASALGKRYASEVGTEFMNRLFDTVEHDRLLVLAQGVGETLSIAVRRRNSRALTEEAYQHAAQSLRNELIFANQVRLQPALNALVFVALPLIERHSINTTDALVLRSALDQAAVLRGRGDDLALVAADIRLLRAGQIEGLTLLNPETDETARLDVLVGAAPS